MFSRLLSVILAGGGLLLHVPPVGAQSPNAPKEVDQAALETLARAGKSIEEAVDAKVSLEVDVASFAGDSKGWNNLKIIAARIVAALSEVGKDQVGKDFIARSVGKVVITKFAGAAATDSAELKDGTLTVKTQATDDAVALLQGVITRAFEKLLPAPP